MTKRMRFPVQTLPMIFLSAILATCAGDKEQLALADEAPVATGNVVQVAVVEAPMEPQPAATSTQQNGSN